MTNLPTEDGIDGEPLASSLEEKLRAEAARDGLAYRTVRILLDAALRIERLTAAWSKLRDAANEMPGQSPPIDRPCASCGSPLPNGYVYRAGYEASNFRTIPQKIGRGIYCDHIPDPFLQTSEAND